MHLQRRYSLGETGSEIFTPHCTTPSIWSGVLVGMPGPRTVVGCEPEDKETLHSDAKDAEGQDAVISLGSDAEAPCAASTTSYGDIDSMDLCLTPATAMNSPSSAISMSPFAQSPTAAQMLLSSQTMDDSHPSLLTLPPEIRHQIYHHLPDTLIAHRPLIYGITPFSGRKTHCLSAICKQIRQEVMAIFYGQNEWVVSLEFKIMYEAFRRWVLEEVGEGAGSLRKLRVGVRCKALAPKVRKLVIKEEPEPEQEPEPEPEAANNADPSPDLNLDGDAEMDTDADETVIAVLEEHIVPSSADTVVVEDLPETMDTDSPDISDDAITIASSPPDSHSSASTVLTPPSLPSTSSPPPTASVASATPEPQTPEPAAAAPAEPVYEVFTIRADGDATFLVDLSEKHHNGRVTVLRSEAIAQDTESVRLILESVVGWLWEKRIRGTMTGADLVEGMDRFLGNVGVVY